MSTLLEDPTPILLYGALTEIVLLVALLATRRGVLLFVMIGVAVLIVLGVIVEGAVVTERERVEAVVYEGAAALQANDLDRLLAIIAPSALRTRSQARSALGRFRLRSVSVKGLEIEMDADNKPPTATAKFDAVISGEDKGGQAPYGNYVGGFEVYFQRHNDRWLVVGHQEGPPHFLRKGQNR